MNILLTHGYSKDNRGDAAIVSAMVDKLRVLYPSAVLSLVTLDRFQQGAKFEGVDLLHAFFYSAIYTSRSTLFRILRTIKMLATTLIWAALFRLLGTEIDLLLNENELETIRAYKNAHTILAVGGGYLVGKNTLHDTVTVIVQLHAIIVGVILKKPVVLFSQSIGPFGNWVQQVLSSFVLNMVSIIMPREPLSTANLRELKVVKPNIAETADVAFLFESSGQAEVKQILSKLGVQDLTKLVAITVRNWLDIEKQESYEQAVAKFAQYLVTQGYTVLFVPQVTSAFHNDDDTVVNDRIKVLLTSGQQSIYFLPNSFNFRQTKSVFEICKYVVGTRMHSVIFALTSRVPALAIAYERKTVGIMSSFGLQEYIIPMEQVTAELLEQNFLKLNSHHAEYLVKLDAHMPIEQERAERAFLEVQAFVVKNGLV